MQRERIEIVFLPFLVTLRIVAISKKNDPRIFSSHFSSYVIYFLDILTAPHNDTKLILNVFLLILILPGKGWSVLA